MGKTREITPQLSSPLVLLEMNRWHVPLLEETPLRANCSLSQLIEEEKRREDVPFVCLQCEHSWWKSATTLLSAALLCGSVGNRRCRLRVSSFILSFY